MKVLKKKQINVVIISLFVTIAIIVIRFIAFFLSNSILILSDALHSLFDLASGIIATYAIIVASKPSDIEHTYGHGKAENIGSFLEAIILVLILILILYDGYERLISIESVQINFNLFIVSLIGITLVLNLWRARTLVRAAQIFKNQIIEADALHFLSDLYGTTSVLIVILLNSTLFSNSILAFYLDPISAIAVSLYFTIPSIKLAKKAIDELMDRAPKGIVDEVRKIINEEGAHVERVRSRKVGNKIFIDAIIKIPNTSDIVNIHRITESIEKRINSIIGNYDADIMIHAEPVLTDEINNLKHSIIKIAQNVQNDLKVHNIEINQVNNKFDVRMHVEFEPTTKIVEAHSISSKIEENIKSKLSNINSITIHIEPIKKITDKEINEVLQDIMKNEKELFKKINVKKCFIAISGPSSYIDIICKVPENINVEEAHVLSTKLENLIKEKLGEDVIITVHTEPE